MFNTKELIKKAAEKGITVIEENVTKNNIKIEQFRFFRNKLELCPSVRKDEIKERFEGSTYPEEDIIEYFEEILENSEHMKSNKIIEKLFDENTIINNIRIGVQERPDESAFFTKNDETNLWEYFYIRIDNESSFKVTEQYMDAVYDKFNYVFADLLNFAELNEMKNATIDTMVGILENMMNPSMRPYIMPKLKDFIPPFESEYDLYVISNTERYRGASLLGVKKVLYSVAGKLNTRYLTIIPSSIHELIVLKKNDLMNETDLLEMVKTVNGTEVKPEDKLCDRVYTFDAYTGDYDYTE